MCRGPCVVGPCFADPWHPRCSPPIPPMPRQSRRFLFILVAIVFTLAIGTAGFVLIDHYSSFDAFYMTLTTMTTVVYGELHPLSTAGRVFNSFLIFFGVTTLFIAVGAMT